jgi:RNA polymerase sigma-70 factor (ECF subfamily)
MAPPDGRSPQDAVYAEAVAAYGPALDRLARAYEPQSDRRLDLLQEIHVALWRSFASFDRRCSLRTWVYRVAHNVAISEVTRRRGRTPEFVALEEIEPLPDPFDHEQALDHRRALDRILALIHRLDPLDRQVILLYLEGLDAASIAEITGFSSGNVATKVHRIKTLLARRFHEGMS